MAKLIILAVLVLMPPRAMIRYNRACLELAEDAWAEVQMGPSGADDWGKVKFHGLKIRPGCGVVVEGK